MKLPIPWLVKSGLYRLGKAPAKLSQLEDPDKHLFFARAF